MASKAKSSWRGDVIWGIAAIVIAVIVEMAIEPLSVAHELAYASYRLFQSGLVVDDPVDDVPVTLVDISDLEDTLGTPRQPLQDLLMAIVLHQPKAIGFDIDFSPEAHGYSDPYDPQFFDLCLKLKEASSVPIFLGVGRTVGATAPEWLGSEKYQSMAAAILIPKHARRLPHSIVRGESDNLGSMSAALARAYSPVPEAIGLTRLLARIGVIEDLSRRKQGDLTLDEFLINYSAIDSIPKVESTSAEFIANRAMKPFFENKLVIIGDGERARDKFTVPGRDKTYPGALVHASGAITRINGPLYEVTHWGRVVLTVLLLAPILGLGIAAREWTRRAKRRPKIAETLEGALVFLSTIVALISVGLFVRTTHVVWDGFLLAFFTLALHHPFQHFFHTCAGVLKRMKAELMILAVLGAATVSAQEKVGYISQLKGPVQYQKVGSAKPVQLVAPANLVDPLHTGDRLRCDAGGSARLVIGTRVHELKASTEWFVVPPWNQPVSQTVRAALDDLYSLGGRAKSVVESPNAFRVLAPVHESKVILDKLALHWNPGREDCPITATVEDVQGKRIWRERDIDMLAGRLDSDALRTALRSAKGPFDLQLVDDCDNELAVTFDILAPQEIASLQSELEAWGRESADPLLRHAGRAAIYGQHGMFAEVADEYEAALALAPQSTELLARTVAAHDRTGNVRRRRELAAHLPADR